LHLHTKSKTNKNCLKTKLLIGVISFALFACNFEKSEVKQAQKGIIDLRQSSLKNVSLQGEFAFTWQKVASPNEMKKVNTFLNVPDEWNKYGYPAEGYATYSVQILLPKQLPKHLALALPNIATAYRLWLNDKKVYELGSFSTTPDSSLAKYQRAFVPIPDNLLKKDTLQVTFQISNYEHFRGGIYNPIFLGDAQILHNNAMKMRDLEVFMLGALAIMMSFHTILFLYLFRKQTYESLYLAILCGLVIVRTLIVNVGSQYWLVLFPESSFEFLLRTEYLVTYAMPIFTLLFANTLIRKVLSQKFLLFAKWIGLLTILLAFLPISTYSYSLNWFYFVLGLTYLVLLYMGVVGMIKGYKESVLITLSFVVLLVFSILEILHHQSIIYWEYANWGLIGTIIFLFIQSFVVSYRVSRAFTRAAYLSDNLKKEVARRTQELEAQKEALEKANKAIEQAQESTMASIRYAQRIQNALLPSNRNLNRHLKEYFIFYQPRDFVSGDFYWFHARDEEFYIAVADCTGHGVPGAIMAVMADISLDYAFFRQEYEDIAQLLADFDRELIKLLNKNVNPDEEPAQDGLVIALCKVNKHTKLLTYTAASSPAFIIREGVLVELNPDKHIIGGSIKEGKEFSSQTFQLKENDMLYLFSDGYQDQFGGEKKKKMGTRRFKEILLEIAPRPIQEQKEILEKEFNAWKGNYSQIDDVLVMGIRF